MSGTDTPNKFEKHLAPEIECMNFDEVSINFKDLVDSGMWDRPMLL